MAERDARWETLRLLLPSHCEECSLSLCAPECHWPVVDELEAEFVQRGEEIERLEAEAESGSVSAKMLLDAEARVQQLEEALREVPYVITMALQWTLVPSDVPEVMREALGLHREILQRVHDETRAALAGSAGKEET